jgi:hypothetical protein
MYTVNTAAADVEAVFRLDGKVQRFSDLERRVYRISRKMLAQQLRSIERVGLILRTDNDEVPLFFRWMRLEQNRTSQLRRHGASFHQKHCHGHGAVA